MPDETTTFEENWYAKKVTKKDWIMKCYYFDRQRGLIINKAMSEALKEYAEYFGMTESEAIRHAIRLMLINTMMPKGCQQRGY